MSAWSGVRPPRRPHERGRWVVLKQRAPFNPQFPWKVILWGGNGEHWADGAEVATYDHAALITYQATEEYKAAYRRDKGAERRFRLYFLV